MGRSLVVIGLVVVGLGLGATDLVLGGHHGGAAGWWLALPLLVAGVGGGLVISPNVTLTLANVPVHQAGAAGGVLNTGQRLGTAAGISVIGSLFFSHIAATGDFGGAAAIGLRATLAFIVLALLVGVVDLVRGRSRDREPQPASVSPAR
jgi:MFS family permease